MNLIDIDKSGFISIKEFRKFIFNENWEKATRILEDLKRIVKEQKLNTLQIFQNFDEFNKGKLDL